MLAEKILRRFGAPVVVASRHPAMRDWLRHLSGAVRPAFDGAVPTASVSRDKAG